MRCLIEWRQDADGPVADKTTLLHQLSHIVCERGLAHGEGRVFDLLAARERAGDTLLVPGLANPHAQDGSIGQATLLFVRLRRPLADWSAGRPVRRVLLTLLPARLSARDAALLKDFYRKIADDDVMRTLLSGDRQKIQLILPTERGIDG